jgi:putative transport protein
MNLLGGAISITGITLLVYSGFQIIFLGYLLGRVRIKGVGLGTAGVFLVAIVFGVIYSTDIGQNITQLVAGEKVDVSPTALKVLETTGLVLFVGSVGLIAGPSFFKDLKRNFKRYALVSLVVIVVGTLTTIACYLVGRSSQPNNQEFVAALSGVMAGALTNTPAFSSSKAAVATIAEAAGSTLAVADAEALVSVGYGITYIFGVIGVVLFVQIVPRIIGANMEEERKKVQVEQRKDVSLAPKRRFVVDSLGLCALAFVLVVGVLVGAFRLPLTPAGYSGVTFSLTSTGGVLLTGLVVGHVGHIGPVDVSLSQPTLKSLRELGLVLFLVGAGVSGGMRFAQYFKWDYFFFGIAITVVPMVAAYLFARFVLKMDLLNNLGSIAGGMTSTPALGSLISLSGTDDVASAYAATYPITLIGVVISSQLLVLLLS